MFVVFVVSAQEKHNEYLDLSFESCPVKGGCPNDKCCTDYACDEEDHEKVIKCCNKKQLVAEQMLPPQNRICSPCVQCSKY